ncbi:MAG: hypothetical protein PVG39_06340 [Desulfobacteraceae bacterium]|jgi:hypothetical protein
MNDISKDTLGKIKEQGIVPRTKGYFLLKQSTVWGLFLLSVILGSIAASAAIFQINNTEWELFRHYRHSILEFILLFIPCFWVLFLAGFSVVAYYYFRRTQSGYRYRTVTVVALSVLLSVIVGAVLYAAGFSERLESVFEEKLPFYRGVTDHNRMVWMSPDKGLLAGKIIGIPEEGMIRLKDLDGEEWNVITNGATWRGRLIPAIDLEIKLLGTRTGKDSFKAQEVRPWFGRRKQGGKGRHRANMPSP